jgi:hypothetical protein
VDPYHFDSDPDPTLTLIWIGIFTDFNAYFVLVNTNSYLYMLHAASCLIQKSI